MNPGKDTSSTSRHSPTEIAILNAPKRSSFSTLNTNALENEPHQEPSKVPSIDFFEKYLTLWVILCIAIGLIIGYAAPMVPIALNKGTVSQISLPIAVLVWGMILPMMLSINFLSLKNVWKSWKGILLTSSVNYLVQPFLMYALALLFFKVVFASSISPELQNEYIAGSVILGGSPCTAMVFVWSFLLGGDATYTLTQVIVNDLLILAFYIPTLQLLLSISGFLLPWVTLILSIVIFVVIPLLLGAVIRYVVVKKWGEAYLEKQLIPKLKPLTIVFLLLTLILIFIFQSENIINSPVHIFLIAVPLTLQTVLIWAITFWLAYMFKIPFIITAPASLIASSNFFELAVAVAISVLGAENGAVLVTTVGVLTEVPTMLVLVWGCKQFKSYFKKCGPLSE